VCLFVTNPRKVQWRLGETIHGVGLVAARKVLVGSLWPWRLEAAIGWLMATLAGAGRSESDFEERTGRMGTKCCPNSPASEGETHCCQRRFVLRSSRPACICSKFKLGCSNLKAAGSCSVPAVEAERRLTASRPPIGKNQRNGTTLARWRGLGGGGRDGMGWDGMDAMHGRQCRKGIHWLPPSPPTRF
jgi:hypothetical protein